MRPEFTDNDNDDSGGFRGERRRSPPSWLDVSYNQVKLLHKMHYFYIKFYV